MLSVYFGVPGCGKSTHAAKIVRRNLRKGIKTYVNYPIQGGYLFDPLEDLGKFDISNCDVILDEASIDFNNRKFKSMPQTVIAWFKKYRHYGVSNIYVYSQSYDDMDITIRRLANRMYLIQRTFLPCFCQYRRIIKRIAIDDLSKQVIDAYEFQPFSRRFVFMPLYWKYFDSFEHIELPKKEFPECK